MTREEMVLLVTSLAEDDLAELAEEVRIELAIRYRQRRATARAAAPLFVPVPAPDQRAYYLERASDLERVTS